MHIAEMHLAIIIINHINIYLDFVFNDWSSTANTCTVPLSLDTQRNVESILNDILEQNNITVEPL